jgi:hypothetical protein
MIPEPEKTIPAEPFSAPPPDPAPGFKAVVRSALSCAGLCVVVLVILFPMVMPCAFGSHGATRSGKLNQANRLAEIERATAVETGFDLDP